MLAQAYHNNMGSLSEQYEVIKIADSTVHFQRFEKLKFQKSSGGACPRTPPSQNFLAPPAQETPDSCASGAISSKHLTLWKLQDKQGFMQETGWKDMKIRRAIHKLLLYFKIVNNLCPTYYYYCCLSYLVKEQIIL